MVDTHLSAEVYPLLPLPNGGGGTTRRDSFGDYLRSIAEMVVETNTNGGV